MHKQTFKYYLLESLLPGNYFLICSVGVWLSFYFKKDFFIITTTLVCCFFLAWFIRRLYNFLICFYYRNKCEETKIKDTQLKGFILISGRLKSGKTKRAMHMAIERAKYKEIFFKRRLAILQALAKERSLTFKEARELNDILISEAFYAEHSDLIPYLVSNVIVEDEFGRKPLPLTAMHLVQEERLPPLCDVVVDEGRAILFMDVYKDRLGSQKIAELAKLFCHFIGKISLFVAIEQDANRCYIDWRSVSSFVEKQFGVEGILRPARLDRQLERLNRRFDKGEWKDEALARKIFRKEQKANSIGFARFNCEERSDPQDPMQTSSGQKHEYVGAVEPFTYDTQMFRNWYECRKQKLKYRCFKDDILPYETKREIIHLDDKDRMIYADLADKYAKEEKEAAEKYATEKQTALNEAFDLAGKLTQSDELKAYMAQYKLALDIQKNEKLKQYAKELTSGAKSKKKAEAQQIAVRIKA